MAISQLDIDSFSQFAQGKIQDSDITLDEVWQMWRINHPTHEEYAENVASINASLADFDNGERGREAGETTKALRKKHALPLE